MGETEDQNSELFARKGRDIIYFNPPFNLYCATNVGEEFRRIQEKHFNRGNDLSKLFNRNKLKITYSCMPNINAKITAHNKALLASTSVNEIVTKSCNCQKSKVCPSNGKCVVSDVI